MGMALDILAGREPSTPRWVKSERAVLQGSGGGNARLVGTGIQLGTISGARGWEANTTAARCVDTISTLLGSVDLTVLRGEEAHDEHPVAQLWNVSTPGAPVSARITRQVAFAMAEVRGEAFLYLDRGPTGAGPVRGTWPIYDEVDVLIEGVEANPHAQQVRGFVVRRGTQRLGLLPSEVLWLRYPHPTKAWGALAPWAAAVGAAELDTYARAWQLGEFRNGAKPGAVIYLGDLDEASYNRAVADYRTGVEGPGNAGKSMLVAGPSAATVSRLSMTPEEMSYLASRVANSDETMLAFGIRPDYFRGQSTYENQRAAKVAIWTERLVPKLDVLGSEVDRQLLPAVGEQAAFDLSKIDALAENMDAIYARIRGIAYTDVILIDEARAQLGLDPLPGGDGQYALTEYRARIALRNTPDAMTGRAARHPKADVEVALPRRARVVAHRGALIPVRTRRAKRKPLHRPDPGTFYATHEAVGERLWADLAAKQQRVVLRALAKLRTSEAAAWAEHRGHAMDLLPTAGIVAPDLIRGVSPFTELALSDTCTCARGAADDLFDEPYWRAQTEEATGGWLRGVWEGAGAAMADALGIGFDVFDTQVLDALDFRRRTLAEQVTATTRRVLDSQLLAVTAEEGWSIPDAEQAIRGVFTDLSGYRARTIARTEVVGGYNAASYLGATASGEVTARVWLTAEDERVRPSHARQNGAKVHGDTDRYPNGCRHPGDPDASPAETVNCRCVETYELTPKDTTP